MLVRFMSFLVGRTGLMTLTFRLRTRRSRRILSLLGAARRPTRSSERALRAAGDVDGDGRADLLISDADGKGFLVLGKELGVDAAGRSSDRRR